MPIPSSSHLAPALNKLETLFARLTAADYKLPAKVQAMMVLAKLPSSMDVVAQMITQAKDKDGKAKVPTVDEIHKAAILSWDQCHLGKGKSSQPAQSNKISAVKCKEGTPSFQQQQRPPQGQQQQQGDKDKKKKNCRGKGKGKSQDHAHIASATYFSGPPALSLDDSNSTTPVVDPRGYVHHPAQLCQGQ